MVLLYATIILFLLLLMVQWWDHVQEGMDSYEPYDTDNNALILAQQNAGNIDYLKTRVDDLDTLRPQVNDLTSAVSSLQDQVSGIVQGQNDYAAQVGSTPITGADNLDDDDEEEDDEDE
jgi:hypothetical protein